MHTINVRGAYLAKKLTVILSTNAKNSLNTCSKETEEWIQYVLESYWLVLGPTASTNSNFFTVFATV